MFVDMIISYSHNFRFTQDYWLRMSKHAHTIVKRHYHQLAKNTLGVFCYAIGVDEQLYSDNAQFYCLLD